MSVFHKFLLLFLTHYADGLQNQYTVFQENMELSDINHKVLDVTAGVFQLNKTANGLNFTFKLKMSLPDDSKISATAFKWIKGDYKLGLINIDKSLASALEMDMFDLQALFLDYCRPPMVWPLQKGEMYRCAGWTPDSTKFPPHLPAGQWKVPITVMFANKTKIVVATWYLKLTYKK